MCDRLRFGAKRLKTDLKSADRKVVGVQVPLRAPIKSIIYKEKPGATSGATLLQPCLDRVQEAGLYALEGGSQGTQSFRKVPGSDI